MNPDFNHEGRKHTLSPSSNEKDIYDSKDSELSFKKKPVGDSNQIKPVYGSPTDGVPNADTMDPRKNSNSGQLVSLRLAGY